MCKTCEMKGISMTLFPLDTSTLKEMALPKAWEELIINNFHPDLLLRAQAHTAWTARRKNEREIGNAKAFLSSLAKGFLDPFSRKQFEPKSGDPYFALKQKSLDAIDELSETFGNRVSSVMWNSLAHLATRSQPEEKKSILKEADLLPHHFGIVDTMLHAMGKVYTFSLYVQSVFSRHTGMILVHNCDCNCSLLNLEPCKGSVEFSLGKEQIFEATQSLFTHQCAESHLILNEKLPFEYTITQEAQELLGVNCE